MDIFRLYEKCCKQRMENSKIQNARIKSIQNS